MNADVSCRLLEVDFSGIEVLMTGWKMGDPNYIRWGRLGIHAALTALYLGEPADLSWSDSDISAYLKPFKNKLEYRPCKAAIHGSAYGLTTYGMCEQMPELFPSISAAKKFQDFYYTLAPRLPEWHFEIRKRAKDVGYLGGPTAPGAVPSVHDHPFQYRHWFWDVLSYQPTDEVTARRWLKSPEHAKRIVYLHGRPFKIIWGGDAKRCVAFFPQSIAAGRLKSAQRLLFHPGYRDLGYYIGDAYFGRTPLLGPIHDSLFLHVPNRCADRVLEKVVEVMQAPTLELPCPYDWGIGPYLRIGVAAKAGRNWAPWDAVGNPHGMVDVEVARIEQWQAPDDAPVLPAAEDDLDDWRSLARVVA